MVLSPVFDTMIVFLALIAAADFFLISVLMVPIVILLEATLLRRMLPGTKAIRNAVILNLSTFILGGIIAGIFSGTLTELNDSIHEINPLLISFLLTLVLSILGEGGVLKLLESKISLWHTMRTSSIINLASYTAYGLAVGLLLWGYESADKSQDPGYLLCIVPLACVIALAVLIVANVYYAISQTKHKVVEEEAPIQDQIGEQYEMEAQPSETSPQMAEMAVLTPREKGPVAPTVLDKWQAPLRLFVTWILVTALGASLAFGLSGLIIYKLKSMGGILWSILLLGILIGGMQWLLLRRHLHNAGWWILASLGGWAVTLMLAARASVLLDFTLDEFITEKNIPLAVLGILGAGLLHGIVLGLFQWLVIRKVQSKSYVWIVLSSLGWMVGFFSGSFVGLSIYYVLQQYHSVFGSRLDINPRTLIIWPVIIAGIATGLTSGAVTGTAFAWWSQRTKLE